MQNDSPLFIDYERPIFWWFSVGIELHDGRMHKTFVRAIGDAEAMRLACALRDDIKSAWMDISPWVSPAKIAGSLVCRSSGRSFAGYADE